MIRGGVAPMDVDSHESDSPWIAVGNQKGASEAEAVHRNGSQSAFSPRAASSRAVGSSPFPKEPMVANSGRLSQTPSRMMPDARDGRETPHITLPNFVNRPSFNSRATSTSTLPVTSPGPVPASPTPLPVHPSEKTPERTSAAYSGAGASSTPRRRGNAAVAHYREKKSSSDDEEEERNEKKSDHRSALLDSNRKGRQRVLPSRSPPERSFLSPYLMMGYLQLFFNAAVVVFIMYLVYQFVVTIQKDVDIKVEEYSQDIMKEIELCSKNYIENKCTPPHRVPHMETTCTLWEKCMNRDPRVVGRAKVSAETFAEIINSFIEPISYKTMVFFLLFFFGFIFLANFAFHFARSKVTEPSSGYPPHVSVPLAITPLSHPQSWN